MTFRAPKIQGSPAVFRWRMADRGAENGSRTRALYFATLSSKLITDSSVTCQLNDKRQRSHWLGIQSLFDLFLASLIRDIDCSAELVDCLACSAICWSQPLKTSCQINLSLLQRTRAHVLLLLKGFATKIPRSHLLVTDL